MNTARRAVATVGAIAAAATLVAAAPAQSATPTSSRVSVSTTDATPASGQTFRLYGAVQSEGHKVPATIHVLTYRNGHWVQLPGAIMQTNRDNTYRIRVILQMKGKRQLRVVADPRPSGIRNAQTTISVTVH
jgi:hypothetical protein